MPERKTNIFSTFCQQYKTWTHVSKLPYAAFTVDDAAQELADASYLLTR